MNVDTLFLLKPDFFDKESGPYFCPHCAQVLGMLAFYPQLKETVEVRFLEFPRPRIELVQLLGEQNQSCPVLVLKTPPEGRPSNLKVQEANGHFFVEGASEIAEYLARTRGIGMPH